MYKIILAVLFGLFQVLKATKPAPKLCVRANKDCQDDVFMCGLAFGRFAHACGLDAKPMLPRSNQNLTHLPPVTPQPCSNECRRAIDGLKRTKRGKELSECDCKLDGHCLVVKARVASCLNRTSHGPYVSCTMSLINCTRNSTCKSLQGNFLNDCQEMINGVKCEEKCLKAQEKLFQSTYGKHLAHCTCDGPGQAYCLGIQAHAKQLRCIPGMDGSGTPAFTYFATDPGIIHGDIEEDKSASDNNTASTFQSPSWTLAVFILTLLLF